MTFPNWTEIDHPFIGAEMIYRPNQEPYDPATDTEPGVLVVGSGMRIEIRRAYKRDGDGQTFFYAHCHETGLGTHLTADEITGKNA